MNSEEIMNILKMIEEGKITAEEGKTLIDAIEENSSERSFSENASPIKKKDMLRIEVDAHGVDEIDNARVRVNIPLMVAKKMAGLTALIPDEAKESLLEKGINLDKIDLEGLIDMFLDGQIDEELVNIEAGDSTKGAIVKVYVDR